MADEWRGHRATMQAKPAMLAVVAFAAAGGAAWFGLDEWQARKGKALVQASLKDPGSAIFERVDYFKATGATCGAVNAKNSFGGYVGFRAFVLDEHRVLTWGPAGNLEDPDLERRLSALRNAIEFRKLVDAKCPGIK